MMRVVPVFSDDIASNIYILKNKKIFLIDAGMAPEGLKPDAIILTHCHFDHIAMAKHIQDESGCEIWMGDKEAEFFNSDRFESSAAKYFGMKPELDFDISRRLKDGEEISFGGLSLRVLLTPGHTPGGICLYEPENRLLFSGDTVFADGYGRYDLLGGDREALRKSISRLSRLDIAELFPGHGQSREGDVASHLSSLEI